MFLGIYSTLVRLHHSYAIRRIRRKLGRTDRLIYDFDRGYRMELLLNDHITQRLLISGSFEPQVSGVISALVRRGMIAVDIGANIGIHTLDLSRLVKNEGRVIAFEPNSSVFAQLTRNIELNEAHNIIAMESALWETDGEETFYYPPLGMEAFGGLQHNTMFKVMHKAQVTTSSLDTSLTKLGLNRVDFIKVDAEGAELPILKGANKMFASGASPYILYESSFETAAPYGYKPRDLHSFLMDLGYVIETIDHANYLALPTRGNI